MQSVLDGSTRIFAILGDPIAQVKSPAHVTASLQKRSRNAILVPFHVTASDLDQVVATLGRIRNLDGLVMTVPHKLAAFRHCVETTSRAERLEAVNVMRRISSGAWKGDMCDGQGFVDAITGKGGQLKGKRALLLGAGGAGTAIAHALLEADVAELSIHDIEPARQDALVCRLGTWFGDRVTSGLADPAGFDILANATPTGMLDPREAPVDLDRLGPGTIVGDVVTATSETALIRAARANGCLVSTGEDMYQALLETMVNFLLS